MKLDAAAVRALNLLPNPLDGKSWITYYHIRVAKIVAEGLDKCQMFLEVILEHLGAKFAQFNLANVTGV